MPTAVSPPLPAPSGGLRARAARGFYLGLVLLMIGMVLLGFWPYYARLAAGRLEAHWLVHLHAAVFSGWMALLLLQAWLVFSRRIAIHRQLGRFGIAYACLLIVLGVVMSFAAPALNVMAGRSTLDESAGFMILPIGDMLLFAGFFAAAVACRRQKELHKRLMVLAAIALVFPAVARFAFDYGTAAVLAAWLLPLSLAMGHDLAMQRRIAPVYFVGLAACLVGFARIGLMENEAWRGVGRRMLLMVLPESFAL